MRPERWIGGLGIALFACQEQVELRVAENSAFTIILEASETGEMTATTAHVATEAESVSVGEGERAYVLTLPRGSLQSAEGGDVDWSSLVLRRRSGPTAAKCDRCLTPTSGTPQLFQPGESCPVPNSAEAWVVDREGGARLLTEGVPAQILDELRLDYPGECPCTPPPSLERIEMAPTSPVSTRSGTPVVITPLSAMAEFGGKLLGFSDQEAFWFDPGTGRAVQTPRSIPKGTHSQKVYPMPDGTMLLATELITFPAESRFESLSFDEEGGLLEVRQLLPPLEELSIDDSVRTSEATYVIGTRASIGSNDGALASCRSADDCEMVNLPRCQSGVVQPLKAAIAVDDQHIMALSRSLELMVGPPFSCQESALPRALLDDGREWASEDLGVFGDRVFVCVTLRALDEERTPSAMLLSTRKGGGEAWQLELEIDIPSGCSGSSVVTPQGIDFFLNPDGVIRVREDGFSVLGRKAMAYPGVPLLDDVTQYGPFLVAAGGDHSVWVRTATGSAFAQIRGPDRIFGDELRSLVARDGIGYSFARAAVWTFDPSSGGVRRHVVPALDFEVHAAGPSVDGQWAWLVGIGARELRLARIRLDAQDFVVEPLAIPQIPARGPAQVAQVSENRILVTVDGSIIAFDAEGRKVREDHRGSAKLPVGAAHGVAYVAGQGGVLERWALDRLEPVRVTGSSILDARAVSVQCPDRADVAGFAITDPELNGDGPMAVGRVRTDSQPYLEPLTEASLLPAAESLGSPSAVLPTSSGTRVFLEEGHMIELGSRPPIRIPFTVGAAVISEGYVFVAGPDSSTAIGTSR